MIHERRSGQILCWKGKDMSIDRATSSRLLVLRTHREFGGKELRILVVDDDPGTLNALRVYLSSAGHEVIVAEDGPHALNHVRHPVPDSEEIDLMVTDLKMPGMNGLELIRKLKKERPRLPMILMTAYGDAHVRSHLLAFDLCGFFEKPIHPESLLKKIKAMCEASGISDGKKET